MFFMLMNRFKPMDCEIGKLPPSLKEVVYVPQATVGTTGGVVAKNPYSS